MTKRIGWIAAGLTVWLAWAMRVILLEQLQPGIDRDVATNGVYALYILHEGLRPLFYRTGAIEPLIVYLQSGSVALFGVNVFALRIVTATIGTLSVPVLYAFVRALKFDRRVAWLGALGMALCVEYAHLSRLGLRAIFVPFFALLLLWFFWRGWRDGHWRDFVAAGIVLGASIYTYISALFFPLLPFALVAHQFIFNRAQLRRVWHGLPILFLAALIVAAPMLGFMLIYPNAAFFRASQVTLLAHPDYERVGLLGVLAEKFVGQLKMFGVAWEGQYNPLSQPLLDPVWFVLAAIGLIISARRARQIEYAWAPLTIFIMLLPDLIGGNEPFPQELRVIGVIPPTFFVAAVGLVALIDWSKRWHPRAGYAIAGVALAWSAFNSFDAYFYRWGAWALHNDHSDFNRVEVAEGKWIANQKDPVMVPLNEYARQPVRFMAGKRAPIIQSLDKLDDWIDQPTWLMTPLDLARVRFEGRAYADDPFAFVLVRAGATFLLPPLTETAAANWQARTRNLPAQPVQDEIGNVVAHALWIKPSDLFSFAAPDPAALPLHFGQSITLVSAEVGLSRLQPGEALPITLWWQPAQRISNDYVLFAHLLDPDENVAAGADIVPGLGLYPTFTWKPGENIPTHLLVRVPLRTPPGKYRIEIGLYDVLNGDRLDIFNARGDSLDSRLILGTVKIAPRVTASFNPQLKQRANFDYRIALLGYDLGAGDTPRKFQFSLYFQALAEMVRDYTLFAHVINTNGEIVAQSDHQPQNRRYPTSTWDVNEQVRDDFALELPPDLPNGNYQIRIGWYDLATGLRLPLRDANNQSAGDAILLDAPLEVKSR
jgi:hypothetical protein